MDMHDNEPLTAAVIKANLTDIINDSKFIFKEIKDKIQKINNDDTDSDDENTESSDSINKLDSLSERFEESAYIVMSCLDIASSRISELENQLRLKEEKIIYQKNTILQLSQDQHNWSDTNPELLSLRRSHTNRLDHLCRLTKEIELLKRKNRQLQRSEDQLKTDCARASLSLARNCDRLRSDYEMERIKNNLQAKEIRELKKKILNKNKIDNNPIQKQSLRMLQKQLRLLNLNNRTTKNNKMSSSDIQQLPSTSTSSSHSSYSTLPDDLSNINQVSLPVDENKAISDIKNSLLADAEQFETGKTWEEIIASSETSHNTYINDIIESISDFAEKMNDTSSTASDDLELVVPPDDTSLITID